MSYTEPMNLSLDQLRELTQSQEFFALPVRMAQEKVPDDTWCMTLDALVVNGAKAKIREAAHHKLDNAQQCRKVAARFAPEIDAWARRAILAELATSTDRPAVGRPTNCKDVQ